MNTRTDYGTDYTTAGNGNGNGAAGDTFAAAGPARSASDGRSTRSLIRELMRQTSSLARKEIALATGEMRENLMEARRDATAITTGGVVLAGGYILLLAAAAALLAEVMAPWIAALIVGGIATLAGYMMVKGGMAKLRMRELKPRRTMDTMHRNADAVREARHGYH